MDNLHIRFCKHATTRAQGEWTGCRLVLLVCRMLANVLFPNWLVTMLLLGLLTFLTYNAARKAWNLHRSEVRYLAQQEEQSHRPASSGNGVPAADGAAAGVAEAKKMSFTQGPSPTRGSAASAVRAAAQTGTNSERQDAQLKGEDMHSIAEQGEQPAASRQYESLEVEGLPSSLSSGEHERDTRQNELLRAGYNHWLMSSECHGCACIARIN